MTNDQDFLRTHARNQQHAGIMFFRHGVRSIGEMVEHLVLIHDAMTSDELKGSLEDG